MGMLMENIEVKTWLASMGLDTGDADALFEFMDKDKDRNVSIDELIEGVSKLKGAARSLDLLMCLRKQEEIWQLLEETHPDVARRHRETRRLGPSCTSRWNPDVLLEDEQRQRLGRNGNGYAAGITSAQSRSQPG